MTTPEFADWFCLKSNRTFMIQPDRDPEFYFGRRSLAEDILRKLERGVLLNKVPKLVLYGAFGAGKTHTLYHIKWHLEHHTDHSFEVRYVDTPPDLHSKSKYIVLHQAMMDKIGLATVRRLLEKFVTANLGPDLTQKLLAYFFQDEDLVNVIRVVAQGGPAQLPAWRWLRGETLPDAQLQSISAARSPALQDLINILVVVGRLFTDMEGSRLVFLVDELEQLEYVTGAEMSTWETAFRKLADQDNDSAGFVFASRAPSTDEFPAPLRHEAFVTRIKEYNFIEIPYLHDVEDILAFVRDLCNQLVDFEKAKSRLEAEDLSTPLEYYPFTPEALDFINQYIQDDPTRALPRELLFSLNECGAAAIGETSTLVTEEVVQSTLF